MSMAPPAAASPAVSTAPHTAVPLAAPAGCGLRCCCGLAPLGQHPSHSTSSVVVVGDAVVVVVAFLVVVVLPSHLISTLLLMFHLPLKQVADATLAVPKTFYDNVGNKAHFLGCHQIKYNSPSSHLNMQTPLLQETLTSESIEF